MICESCRWPTKATFPAITETELLQGLGVPRRILRTIHLDSVRPAPDAASSTLFLSSSVSRIVTRSDRTSSKGSGGRPRTAAGSELMGDDSTTPG